MTTTGNQGLDQLADAIAARVLERMEQGKQRYLRVVEAAKYLGVSRRTLDSYIAEGQIPHIRQAGVKRIDRADLDKWAETRKTRR